MPELTIKTYLPLANGHHDIRRFTVNTDEADFSSIQQKIGTTYELQPGTFKILWTGMLLHIKSNFLLSISFRFRRRRSDNHQR